MKQHKIVKIVLFIFILLSIFTATALGGLPANPRIEYNYTETVSPKPAAYLNTTGGSFTTLILNATGQNYKWKAYVGNATGKLALQDQSNYSIYDWRLSTISGNVYVSRNESIDWTDLTCANTTTKTIEDTYLNINSSRSDSINMTFNSTTHKRFYAANNLISNSSCPSISTYIGGQAQSSNEENKFQEILLKDSRNSLLYTTILEDAVQGFDNSHYDFQMIVAEDETRQTGTTYYFYLELV
jgi:hypothetical protein